MKLNKILKTLYFWIEHMLNIISSSHWEQDCEVIRRKCGAIYGGIQGATCKRV